MRFIFLGASLLIAIISFSVIPSQAADCGYTFDCYGNYGPATVATPTRPPPIPPPNTYLRRLQQRGLVHMYLPRPSLNTPSVSRSSRKSAGNKNSRPTSIATPPRQPTTRLAGSTTHKAKSKTTTLQTNKKPPTQVTQITRSTARKSATTHVASAKTNIKRKRPELTHQAHALQKEKAATSRSLTAKTKPARAELTQLGAAKPGLTKHAKRATTSTTFKPVTKLNKTTAVAKSKVKTVTSTQTLAKSAHPVSQTSKTVKRCSAPLALQNKAHSLESAAVAAATQGKAQLARSLFKSAAKTRNQTTRCP